MEVKRNWVIFPVCDFILFLWMIVTTKTERWWWLFLGCWMVLRERYVSSLALPPPPCSYSRFSPPKRIPGPRRRARPSSNPVTVVSSPWSERLVVFIVIIFFLITISCFSLRLFFFRLVLSDTFVLCFDSSLIIMVWGFVFYGECKIFGGFQTYHGIAIVKLFVYGELLFRCKCKCI